MNHKLLTGLLGLACLVALPVYADAITGADLSQCSLELNSPVAGVSMGEIENIAVVRKTADDETKSGVGEVSFDAALKMKVQVRQTVASEVLGEPAQLFSQAFIVSVKNPANNYTYRYSFGISVYGLKDRVELHSSILAIKGDTLEEFPLARSISALSRRNLSFGMTVDSMLVLDPDYQHKADAISLKVSCAR